jgi:hypothetical protein
MPNYCQNNLSVWGDITELSDFKRNCLVKADAGSPYEFDFTFEGLYPTPQELADNQSPVNKTDDETESDFKARLKRYEEDYGYTNWYEWRIHNWGTKWDASETIIITNESDELYIGFDTAWAPPINWLKKVSIQYPNLSFRMDYMEEGQNYCGAIRIGDGEIVEDEGEPIYTNDQGEEVYRDDDGGWWYTKSSERVEDEAFWPISHNPFV